MLFRSFYKQYLPSLLILLIHQVIYPLRVVHSLHPVGFVFIELFHAVVFEVL